MLPRAIESCLTAQGYAIGKEEGCIMCKGLSKLSVKSQEQVSKKTALSGDQYSSKASSQALRGKKSSTPTNTFKNYQENPSTDSSKATSQACENPYSTKRSTLATAPPPK